MELRKEYAEIVNLEYNKWADCAMDTLDVCKNIALACQELADRPPKWLSNEEIAEALAGKGPVKNDPSWIAAGQRVIAAHIAKQREPETVTVEVRLYRTTSGQPNCVSQVDASLDANFPFGNPTYKWIGEAFEITREVA